MSSERRVRLWGQVVESAGDAEVAVDHVCAVAVTLYRRGPGRLNSEQLADALLLADTACALLLDSGQAGPRTGEGYPERAGPHHPEVHQATGMVTVQLGVPTAVALIRLRAYAHDRRLRDVAADIVARRLRFEPDSGGAGR